MVNWQAARVLTNLKKSGFVLDWHLFCERKGLLMTLANLLRHELLKSTHIGI